MEGGREGERDGNWKLEIGGCICLLGDGLDICEFGGGGCL